MEYSPNICPELIEKFEDKYLNSILSHNKKECFERLVVSPIMGSTYKKLFDLFSLEIKLVAPDLPKDDLYSQVCEKVTHFILTAVDANKNFSIERTNLEHTIKTLTDIEDKTNDLLASIEKLCKIKTIIPVLNNDYDNLKSLSQKISDFKKRDQRKISDNKNISKIARDKHIAEGIKERKTSGREYMDYLRTFISLLESNFILNLNEDKLKQIQFKKVIAEITSIATNDKDGNISTRTITDFFKNRE